jgi:hypothetical protein
MPCPPQQVTPHSTQHTTAVTTHHCYAATASHREAIAIQKARVPANDEHLSRSMRRLANVLARQQRWQAAAVLLTEHLAAAEAASAGGGGPSDVLGLLRLARGQVMLESGGPAEALQVLAPLVGQKRAGPGGVMSSAGQRTVSSCCVLSCLGWVVMGGVSES